MDEIYAGAKCTVLLLRDPILLVLVPVVQEMRCNVKSKTAIIDWPHNCLLSQSCTTLPSLPVDEENKCIEALRHLYDGTWRRRAWIFQEILLSKKYLLSPDNDGFIDLSDIGIIANLFLQRHPNETWLMNFSDWCRRLFYLRSFYTESKFHNLSEANVLQMATGLEASVEADRIYALCGILRLKDVPYNDKHSVKEAFQVLVEELVKRGRLAWLYAIPPPLHGEGIHLGTEHFTPFILTRLSDAFVANRNKMHFSSTSIGFPVMCLGKITKTKSLADMLQEASDWSKEHNSIDFPPERQDILFVPKMIRRIALDLVNPLLVDPLFGQITMGLGITFDSGSRPTRVWRMVMALATKDVTPSSSRVGSVTESEEISTLELVNSAARSLQDRLRMAQYEFLAVWWRSDQDGSEILALGPRTCEPGNRICSVKDDKQLLLAAKVPTAGQSTTLETTNAQFKGMIYNLNNVLTIQWRVRILVFHIVVTPVDMQNPVLGDHPFNDKFKDCRFDEYMKTGASKENTLFSLFGKSSWTQKGDLMYLNFTHNG
jgi:hypothetical protein